MQRSSAFRPASTDNEYGGDRKCFFRSVHEDHQARAGGRLFFNIQPGKHEAREVDETAEGRGGRDSSEGAGHSAILGRVYKCRGAFIGRVSMLCIRAEHTGQGRQKKISLDPRGCEGLLLHSCASQRHIIRCVANTRKNSRFYISFVKGTV